MWVGGSVTTIIRIACIDPHQTGFVGKGSDNLQLIKFWPTREGVCGGAKISGSALLQSARSVCISSECFVIVYCIQTGKDIIRLLSWAGSPIILVSQVQPLLPSSKGVPSVKALNTQGVGKSYFRLKSPFILEMARDGPSVTMNINKKSGCLVVRDDSDDLE